MATLRRVEPLTLVSVDLDDPCCYHAIHGLPPPDPRQAGAVLEGALPRFLDLFGDLGISATFFVIGRDLERDLGASAVGAKWLRRAVDAGHELANHSHAHAYDLSRWPRMRQRDDLARCDELLRELGARPVGFRAPGYTHDDRLLSGVAELGYSYDASALPSWSYYGAKLAVMGGMALRGRRSASLASGARSFFGGRFPRYREDLGLWRVPVSCTPLVRIPLIGTTLLAGPDWLSGALRRIAVEEPYFHLELHGIDLADPVADGWAPGVCARQPELAIPLQVRLERLRWVLSRRGSARKIAAAFE